MLTDILEKYKDKKPMDFKTAVERSYPISSVINMMEEFAKEKMANFWKLLKEEKPICTTSGVWDGLKSEPILLLDDKGVHFVGTCYQGTLDGNEFCSFYDENDFDVENVKYWANIPMLME